MIVKVCGINNQMALDALTDLSIDMIGLNFYPPSKRYLSHALDFKAFPSDVTRVGVFVNESEEEILKLSRIHSLDFAQLHGDESLEFCKALSKEVAVIKVFRLSENIPQIDWEQYAFASYLLFDKNDPKYGGSGKKFNWDILQSYSGNIPFILSGGIGPEDAKIISELKHPLFQGVDINSKFESSPGTKDPKMVNEFLNSLKN